MEKLNKVAQINPAFWLIKIIATTKSLRQFKKL